MNVSFPTEPGGATTLTITVDLTTAIIDLKGYLSGDEPTRQCLARALGMVSRQPHRSWIVRSLNAGILAQGSELWIGAVLAHLCNKSLIYEPGMLPELLRENKHYTHRASSFPPCGT